MKKSFYLLLISLILLLISSCSIIPINNNENYQSALIDNFPIFTTCSEFNEDLSQYLRYQNHQVNKDNLTIDLTKVNYFQTGVYPITITYLNQEYHCYLKFQGEDIPFDKVQLTKPTLTFYNGDGYKLTLNHTSDNNASIYQLIVYNESFEVVDKSYLKEDVYYFSNSGTYYITVKAISNDFHYLDSLESNREQVIVSNNSQAIHTSTDHNRLQEMISKPNYFGVGITSQNSLNEEVNLLIVPVDFQDTTYTETQLAELDLAFNGSSFDTGYESVKSYYLKSSYHKLNLNFDIAPVYKYNLSSRKFKNSQTINETDILKQYVQTNPDNLDFSKYDVSFDNDTDIDGIYLIYNYEQNYEDTSTFWAWVSFIRNQYPVSDFKVKDTNLYINYYMWASFYYIKENIKTGLLDVDRFGNKVYPDLKINSLTYIHETGHMLGLNDYYDEIDLFTSNANGGCGCFDMMDSNVGDHCPYTKINLNWIDPIVCSSSVNLTLHPFVDSGEAVVIFKNQESFYSEYLTIDFYTPTNLNRFITADTLDEEAVRIMKVNNELKDHFDSHSDNSIYKYNNQDTAYREICYVEADGINQADYVYNYQGITKGDLFYCGMSFTPGKMGTVFYSYTWDDGSVMNFEIRVLEINSDYCNISIIFH